VALDHRSELTDVPAIARLQQAALVVGGLGLVLAAVGFMVDREHFFRAWLIGFVYCLGLSLGCLALLMLQHMSGGKWGLVSRRVFEAGSRTLPVVALMFIPVVLGMRELFLWARPEAVQADHILQMKAPYLNVTFFIGRAIVYFALWMLCAWLLTRWSSAQDRGEVAMTAADSVRFRAVSGPGLLLMAITVTFASVDWIMSIDPHWFSTIFGLLALASMGLSALALTILVLSMAAPVGGDLGDKLSAAQFHDLGKLLLAFVMLWAYLSFSQFLIIWSGNLPEEIPWYIARIRGGWGIIAILLVVGHFALPFLLLLSRDLKRHGGLLARVAAVVLVMRLFDIIWLIAPTFGAHAPAEATTTPQALSFPLHWMDIAIPLGLAGVWLFVFARLLRTRALLPVNDPYFKEAFAHDAH
jgi:hypothetical protein